MSDRTDNDEMLRRSVTDMRAALEEGPLGRLRTLMTGGAVGFAESETVADDMTRVLAEVAEIVRRAKADASQWVSRDTRAAATPIGLDRFERAEEFLRMAEAFHAWVGEGERRSAEGGAGFDHSEWRRTLLEAYDRMLHACRSMRREIMWGQGRM